MVRILCTVEEIPCLKGLGAAIAVRVRFGITEVRAQVEPHFSFLFLELHIGRDGVVVGPPAIEGGGVQVAAVLEGDALRLVSGPGVRVLVIGAHRRFRVLDAGGVGIHAQLGRRGQPLVQGTLLPIPVKYDENRIGVVDILRVAYHRHLVLLSIGRYQRIPAPEEAPAVPEVLVIGLGSKGGASFDAGIAEPALLVFLLQGHVQHFLAGAVLQAGSPCGLRVAVYHADFVHHGRRQVVEGRTLVVEEEGAPANGELVNFLAVELHLAVFRDFHAGHALQQVLEHGVGAHPEGGGVELHGVFLHHNGIAHVGDHGRLQVVLVHLQADGTHVHPPLPEVLFPDEGLVAHHLHMEDVTAVGDLVQLGLSLGVREREVGDGSVLGRNHIHGGKAHGLVGEGVQHGGLDFAEAPRHEIVVDDEHLSAGRQPQ